ncbi:MAG: hypothetical protein U1G08_03960 [Verrucomicrobiota bacterium]
MNSPDASPEDSRLRGLLRDSHPQPPLPPRFQEEVWRRIDRSAPAESPGWASAWEHWLRDRFLRASVAVAVAAAVVAGAWTGLLHGESQSKAAERGRYLASVDPLQRTLP